MHIKELGHVVLYVTDIEKAAHFYRDVLGFHEIAREHGTAIYSAGRTHHELLLIEIGGTAKKTQGPEPGLYHIGFKIGDSTVELKAAYQELITAGVTIIGTADHHVTHSLYILDPDGNELELYVDINDNWKGNPREILKPGKPLYFRCM